MKIIDNAQIRAAIIARLKQSTTLMGKLPSSDEIRETNYQGTVFSYPNVRVRVTKNDPIMNCFQLADLGVQVNSELDSSSEAEEISGIIAGELNDISFSHQGVALSLRITHILPAIRADERTWRTEALFSAVVS
jgi:hypothetical protein